MKVCACCGHPLPSSDVLERLTKTQARIFAEIERARQRGISRSQLIDNIYSCDPAGGPDWAMNGLYVQLFRMKKLLAPFGLRIETMRNGNRRLVTQ